MPELPPGYTPYPRTQIQPPNLSISLDVIPEAWRLFTQKPFLWLANGLISMAVVVPYLVYIVRLTLGLAEHIERLVEDLTSAVLPITLISYGVITFLYFQMAGSYPLVAKQLRGEPVGIGDVLDFNGRMFQTLLSAATMSFLILAGYSLCYFPGPLLEGVTIETPYRVLDLGENPLESIRGSYRTIKSRLLVTSVTVHLLTLILSIPMLCGVGIIVGWPMYNICRALLYHRLREMDRLQRIPFTGAPQSQ